MYKGKKKKKMKQIRTFAFLFIKMIFVFLSRHETCLFTPITISCNFQICKSYSMIKSLHLSYESYHLSILSIKYNTYKF